MSSPPTAKPKATPVRKTTVPEANAGLVLDDKRLRTFLSGRQQRREPLEEPKIASFLGETLTLTASLVPSEAGSLLLDDPRLRGSGSSTLTFVATFGDVAASLLGTKIDASAGIAGHVYQTGLLHVSNDAQNDPRFLGDLDSADSSFHSRSIVAAPLRFEGEICGVFELVNRIESERVQSERRTGFSEHDTEIVRLVSGYISRALLNATDVIKKNELALIDDLTGLRNSRGMDRSLHNAIKTARKTGSDVGALFVDLDRLKSINDSRGHRYGSAAIRKTGQVIRDVVAERGLPFRFGGDEFVVIVPLSEDEEPDTLAKLAERLVYHVRRSSGVLVQGGGSLPPLTVSVGVASMRRNLSASDDDSVADVATRLLAAADRALYRAKRNGRDRVALATRRDDTLQRPITGLTPRSE